MKITDGLAQRETVVPFGTIKLAMGSGTNLKGFTTGDPMPDS